MRHISGMIQAQPSTDFRSLTCGDVPVSVGISRFRGESRVEEYHLMLSPTEYGSTEIQLDWLQQAYRLALKQLELEPHTAVFRRFFCSDLTNQAATLRDHQLSSPQEGDDPCAISRVGQPPAPPAKVALWAYHIADPQGALTKESDNSSLYLRRGDLTHIWTAGTTCTDSAGSYDQTRDILSRHEDSLRSHGLSISDNVIRTWFFVRDVDANYKGLVDARREVFADRGLTTDTHYIASTGIQGASADAAAVVTMDAYAIAGVSPDQIDYLSAPDYLSPTSIYGVTFERGVSVSYRDRKHVLISGTASIDSVGQIVHPGDILRQLDRTIENIEALLKEGGATLRDACMFIVYVRDASDVTIAEQALSERFGGAPFQVVVAPVCRPGWLIEIECIAIVPASCPALPAF